MYTQPVIHILVQKRVNVFWLFWVLCFGLSSSPLVSVFLLQISPVLPKSAQSIFSFSRVSTRSLQMRSLDPLLSSFLPCSLYNPRKKVSFASLPSTKIEIQTSARTPEKFHLQGLKIAYMGNICQIVFHTLRVERKWWWWWWGGISCLVYSCFRHLVSLQSEDEFACANCFWTNKATLI